MSIFNEDFEEYEFKYNKAQNKIDLLEAVSGLSIKEITERFRDGCELIKM